MANPTVELRIIGNFDLSDAKVAKIFNEVVSGGMADIFWDARQKAPVVEVRKYPSRARRGLPTRYLLRNALYVEPLRTDDSGTPVPSGQTATGNKVYALHAGFREGTKAANYIPFVVQGTGPKHGTYHGLKFLPEPRESWKIPAKYEEVSNLEYAETEGRGTEADPFTDILKRRVRRKVVKFSPMVLPNPPRVWTAAAPETFSGDVVVGADASGRVIRKFHPRIIERRGRGRLTIPGQEHNPFLYDAVQRGRTKMRKEIKEAMSKALGVAARDLHFRMNIRIR